MLQNTKTRKVILILLTLTLLIFILYLVYSHRLDFISTSKIQLTQTSELILSPDSTTKTPIIEKSRTSISSPTFNPSAQEGLRHQGLIVLSMQDGLFAHLFLFHPLYMPLTRLTSSEWDDTDPSISPDGKAIALSSKRNGFWDIQILDIISNERLILTDTPEYDGKPTWSPDGEFIAYESYIENNLEILILSINNPSQTPIRLTDHPGPDVSPAWSPLGRRIAFTSTRTGDEEIWLADLDRSEDRFINISQNGDCQDTNPAWSPDGRYLAWSAQNFGETNILVWDSQNPNQSARLIGSGNLPIWSPVGDLLLSRIPDPNHTILAGYLLSNNSVYIPPIELPGSVYGMDWQSGDIGILFESFPFDMNANSPSPTLWQPVLNSNPLSSTGRYGVSKLDVHAPYPFLHDAADESFISLRVEVNKQIGWNFLDNLANAYLPITEPPLPNMQKNWSFTGRSFEFTTVPLQAGWIYIAREDISGQVYWRVYVKTRYQDGSQGKPIKHSVWDLNTRYGGNPEIYENGGQGLPPPSGYYIDFTDLARFYGWERLFALQEWRTYYSATRYNQFILRDNLTWDQAMAELYPAEILQTATYVPTRTRTPTETPKDFVFETSTPLPPPTATNTPRATWTAGPDF